MPRKFLKVVDVSRDLFGLVERTNPATDTGSVRVGFTAHEDAITLLARRARPGGPVVYPTGAGYRAKFPVHTVPGCVSWLLGQWDTVEPTDPEQDPPEVTDVRARLQDGTDERFWDGGAWAVVVDPDADWNTLQEVTENLPAWDPDLPLGPVFELSTTDRRFTPYVRGYRLMYSVDLPSELNDWIYGALVGGMLDTLRPLKDLILVSDGTVSVDFGAVVVAVQEDGWDFRDVVAVFNETSDPNHRVDLLASYNSTTKIATLTGAPTAADRLLLRVQYAPQIAVTTDPDFEEVAACPAVLFDAIDVLDLGEAPTGDAIVDEYSDPPIGTLFPAPRHAHVEIRLAVTAPLSVDLHRLSEAVTGWLQARRTISSPVTGDAVTLRVIDPLDAPASVTREGVRSATMVFRLEHVYFHHRDAIEAGSGVPGSELAYGVKKIGATFDTCDPETVDFEIGGS